MATEGESDSGEEDLGSYMDVVANLREQQDAVRACWVWFRDQALGSAGAAGCGAGLLACTAARMGVCMHGCMHAWVVAHDAALE